MPTRFVRDAAMTGGSQVASRFCGMIAGIAIARALGPAGKGTMSVFVSLAAITVLVACLGVDRSTVYFHGRFKPKRESVVSNSLLFGALGGLVALSMLVGLVVLFRRALLNEIGFELFLLFAPVVPLSYFVRFAQGIVLAEKHVFAYNLPELISGVTVLVGTIAALLILGPHIVPLIILAVVTQLLIAATLGVYIARAVPFRFAPSLPLLKQQVIYGLKNQVASLSWVVLLQSDLLLCNYFLGRSSAGVYSVAVSLGVPLTLSGTVVGTLIFQRVSADERRSNRVHNTNQVMRTLTALVIGIVTIIAVGATWAVPIIYGSGFGGASKALLLLLPGLCALSLQLVLMNFLAGEGSPPVIYIAPLIGVLLNLGPNLYVIPHYGINGAAVTSTVGYTIVFVIVLVYYMRTTGSSPADVLRPRARDLSLLWRRPSTRPTAVGA